LPFQLGVKLCKDSYEFGNLLGRNFGIYVLKNRQGLLGVAIGFFLRAIIDRILLYGKYGVGIKHITDFVVFREPIF
jgi:hypothetical protein